MKIVIASLAAVALAVPAAALACDGEGATTAQSVFVPAKAQAKAEVKTISIDEVVKLRQQSPSSYAIVDVNKPDTRAKLGVIPGARMLSSASTYDPAKELPAGKDTKLVFYCANLKCKASHQAAQRAVDSGYVDVSVLPDGIAGWRQAGQSTSQPNS